MPADYQEIKIQNLTVVRERMNYAWKLVNEMLHGGTVIVTLGREKRTLSQNRKLWPMLSDVCEQVDWYGFDMDTEDWKHLFTALQEKQRIVPGIEGGMVGLGKSTSKMSKRKFAELIEIIYAFGAEKNVEWSEKSTTMIEEYMRWLEQQRSREVA
jgi:hypothetical protein